MAVLVQAGQSVAMVAEASAVLAMVALVAWEQRVAAGAEQHALCPLIDMFNHDGGVQVRCGRWGRGA